MPEKKTLNEDLFYKGSSASLPRLHTCENKVPFWDFKEFAVTPSKGQSSVLQAIDHSVARSMTAQPPGSRPSALRVAAHGQQAIPLAGGFTPRQRCSQYSPS